MTRYRLVFLGFGNVGQALAQLLLRKRAELLSLYDLDFSVTGIATGRHGSAIDPDGLDLQAALEIVQSGRSLESISKQPSVSGVEFIQACPGDVCFENTPVNYQSGEPAISHLKAALQAGMQAITANKGPVVHAYRELTDLAAQMNRRFYFESTVMDGAPIFSLFRGALPGAELRSFRGVLNSTTNLILTRMETGAQFADAVAYAQQIGIAETDPSGDVDGWDAAIKVAALVTVLMGIPLLPGQVDRTGIGALTLADIQAAKQANQRWKLVCSAKRQDNQVVAQVKPELIPASSPLYAVEGTSSIIEFKTDVLGPLSIVEANPGPDTTAYGLFADFLNAVAARS
jgi:homoserine dehydrogenase